MLSLRVVKGAVNFIVPLLGFGVDADRWALPGFSSPRDIQVSDQIPATKVRRFLPGRPGAPGWGARQGVLQCQRPWFRTLSPLCVPPPESDKCPFHSDVSQRGARSTPLCSVLVRKEAVFGEPSELSLMPTTPPFLFSFLISPKFNSSLVHKFCHSLCVLASMSELIPQPQEHSLFTDVFSVHTSHLVKVPAEN